MFASPKESGTVVHSGFASNSHLAKRRRIFTELLQVLFLNYVTLATLKFQTESTWLDIHLNFCGYFCGYIGKRKSRKPNRNAAFKTITGGSGEIRTHGGLASSAVFKTAAFNRSATLPAPGSLQQRGRHAVRVQKNTQAG